MKDSELLDLFFAHKYPSLNESMMTDPEARERWLAQARSWYKDHTASGFRAALTEFRRLQGHTHYSRETTLRHAMKALKHAGLMS